MLKKVLYSLLGLALLTAGALGANNLSLSTGTTFLQGFRLVDGTDFNTVLAAVNALRNQNDGTTTGTYKGVYNGTVGATTPSTGVFTTLSSSGAYTPTGGVAAAGGLSLSPRLISTGNEPAIATTSGTNAAAVTTETYFSEIFVPANTSSTGVAPFNGTAIAGNVQCYLVDSTGAQVAGVLTASTAASGTTAYQLIPWTGGPYVIKGPATYYVACQANNTGYNFRFHTVGTFATWKQTGTTYGTLPTVALVATFTTSVGPLANLY